MAHRISALFAIVMLMTICSGRASGAPPAVPAQSPIVNGQTEPGFEGVGALTLTLPMSGYHGAFCSGTLMGQSWVLTAAHCLAESPEFSPSPALTKFYMGPDARPVAGGELPEGTFVEVDRFYVHPNYDPATTRNDIAMMHLAQPVFGIQGYSPNTKSFDDSFLGESILYVGYGVIDGNTQEGGGIKRSTSLRVVSYDNSSYISMEFGTGVCFGDSGGPGLMELNGQWRIMGVNSTGWGTSENACGGGSTHTRVDNYSDWVFDVMENQKPDCHKEHDLCNCPQACNENGSCNNLLCQTWECKDFYPCYMACGVGDYNCQEGCLSRAAPEAVHSTEALLDCMRANCFTVPGETPEENCPESYCSNELSSCLPAEAPGEGSCRDILDCRELCPEGESNCPLNCFSAGTVEARAAWDELWRCMDEGCLDEPHLTLDSEACAWQECAVSLVTCAGVADCNPAGGDCDAQEACAATPMGQFDCVKSSGAAAGDSCDPSSLWPECADGLGCLMVDGAGQCVERCFTDAQCDAGVCGGEAMEDGSGARYCVCDDADGDGACAADDCDPSDGSVFPGAEEVCEDGVDNNCNGEVDEGCSVGKEEQGASSSNGCSASPIHAAMPWGLLLLLASLSLAMIARRRSC